MAFAVAGAGAAGFLLGREQAPDRPAGRRVAETRVVPAEPEWLERRVEALDDAPSSPGEILVPPPPPIPAEDFLRQMKEHAGSPYAQKMMMAYVGEAARRGSEMLPEIRRLLREGTDIAFPRWEETGHGYPSLRAALMDAAVATGDPAATEMLRDVAATTQNPVEIAFSAHLLDQVGAMDAGTARRVFDSLTLTMSDEQRKMVDPIARRVLPAAAAADPIYAEAFLSAALRADKGADLRLATAALDGMEAGKARDFTIYTLAAGDVKDRAKNALAARAAGRREIEVVRGLREMVEAGRVTPQAASQMARGAVNGSPFGRIEKSIRDSVRSKDLDAADRSVREYTLRLEETKRLITAAQGIGGKVDPEILKMAGIYGDRLNRARRQVAEERARLLQSAH